jgi:carbamoylphosphate synthase small subunit
MKFGHHGANHPVQDLESGRVFITSQNHGFAVDEATLPEAVKATHRSLFDGSLQGITLKDKPAFGFQGHPEASPGPHDLKPLFGICLGFQILGLAAGARTVKMKFGHHGANHPVQDLESGRVFITSQNHGFAVDEATLPEAVTATHRSLFDGSLQGITLKDKAAFGFQGHPEASPGPHDLKPLFERFNHLMLRRLQAQLKIAGDSARRQQAGAAR